MCELLLGWDAGASRQAIGFTQSKNEPQAELKAPELIRDGGDGHTLIFAPTGAGKSRGVVIPNLLSWPGPAIVIDVKGELTATTAEYRRKVLGQKVCILDPWGVTGRKSGSLNPLDVMALKGIDAADQAIMLAGMFTDGRAREPFWTERAESVISGLLLAAHHLEKPISWVAEILHLDDVIYQLAILLDSKNLLAYSAAALASVIGTTEITRSGILSTAQSYARFLLSPAVREAFGPSSFPLEAVTRGRPMTIYLVIPPSKLVTQAPVMRLWLSMLMSAIMERRRLPTKPTLFVLDEVAQLGRMEQVRSMMTLGRGYGCRTMLVFQSYAQLAALYSDHATLMENAAATLTFGHAARSMSAVMAEQFGDISADGLFRMKRNEIAIKLAGRETMIGRRLDYLADPIFAGRFRPNPMFAGRAA